MQGMNTPLPRTARRWAPTLLAAVAAVAASALTAAPARADTRPTWAEQAHAQAVLLFRQARFAEAYGRFILLADAGHGPSARHALWMCEQGPALFGKDWDCSPEQVADWARAGGVMAPAIGPRLYATSGPRRRP
jgi:hypothetical protein